MPSMFFLRYIFIPLWHSSAQTTCGSLFLEKKKREGRKKTQNLSVLHQDPLWQLQGEHIHTSVTPCYQDSTPRQACAGFHGWKIPMGGYTTVRGPLIKPLWPKSFVLFHVTDIEQQRETVRPLMSQEHETLPAACCRITCVWKNSETGLFAWAEEDGQYQQA